MATTSASQLIENGFVSISRGIYMLRKEGKHQEAYESLRQVIMLLEEDRAEIRKIAEINL